jgi:hypothetical protein
MKEHPILFSRPMVRAILEGRKTQTRRIVKHPAIFRNGAFEFICNGQPLALLPEDFVLHASRHGHPGDRLWVKETFAKTEEGYLYREWSMYDSMILSGEQFGWDWTPSIFMPRTASRITLEITGVRVERLNDISEDNAAAEGVESEIWDQSVSVRNYMVKDGWFNDWGIEDTEHVIYVESEKIMRRSFSSLWESINGPDSWKANPWVWVIEFKRL